MKFVIQVVSEASVSVDDQVTGQIGKGILVLIGVGKQDTKEIADKMLDKMLKLRIFEDENGKTNLSLADVGGSVLLVSQFTLYANCRHGNRPSFTEAGGAEFSNELYEYMIQSCRDRGIVTEQGVFGADMKVRLVNEGPFTIVMDSVEMGWG